MTEIPSTGYEERNALGALPVIDVFALLADSSIEERRRVGREIRRACIDIGFFYIIGHGIAPDELDTALALGKRFFALPLAEKTKLLATAMPARLGYFPLTAADDYGAKRPDLKERFSASREIIPGEPEQGRFGAGHSRWPEEAVLPGFTDFFKTHIEKRMRLTRALARGFALSLDLPETYFAAPFAQMGCVLMFNHYPKLEAPARVPDQWSFSPHTDYGAFTILLQDSSGGLQVRNAAGAWIDAPPRPGSFVVNIGDMFAMWTNDLYVSTLHRVLNFNDAERLSLAFFTYPQGLTEIRCIETCTGPGNPPRYAPVQAEAYNRSLVEYANRNGRPGIAARTAERLNTAEARA